MRDQPSKEAIQAWIQLHRVQRKLLEAVENALKSSGLPPLDWYDVLLELQRANSAGLRQYEIGDKVLLNKHNLSRLIDRLENHQLVVRHACAEDGRGNRIIITDAGEAMLRKMWPVYSQTIQAMFGLKLKKQEFAELSALLDRISDQE